ncbi:MAG: ATP-grasp fold amidoligase family protein [Candidatus Faecousia sp.]|nr:ATP-grasp fold amidoligase family protein [Candidatus Faecousia sp.]
MSKLSSLIRSNLTGLLFINRYHEYTNRANLKKYTDEEQIRRWYYKKSGGRYPDLENPKTFSEKQQWYKLHHHDPLMEQCADKYDVRQYVTGCGYGELLNEIHGVYESADDIDPDKLPDKCVIKAAHGSGFNLIVRDKSQVNWRIWKKIMASWLRQDIYWSGREWVYKNLKRRLIVEKYLEDATGGLLDYKFFCFNGQPRFMQLEVGRYTTHNTRNFYDMDWNLMPFGKEMEHDPNVVVEKPETFEQMKQIASDLCKPFSFVRVDLYSVNCKVYFGELTFFPAGGAPDLKPPEYDRIIGDMWDITE